ncbi:hypothetical protein T8K17_19910 [Thalassobaculum sp. OXR-137]|uniref:hypothetical protein n=1 Tax=Thalassobaculum sp. OXR-137 TaxID=3100173 RepID=UPI002AC89F90|nr:hypothetical protein [Thalassobaculum sp. OXR-137]WPZ33488.1 hypothetical protein T8K17_19910 [Thalassobaculum sp. OXR-137]
MTDRPAADAPAAPPAPRRLLGVRVAAWVEIALFFVAVLAIDALLLDGDRFWDVRPHPFWLIVILVAVQYGANASLVAALTASLALTVGNLPVPELGADVFQYWAGIGLRPALWVGVGQILGQMRDRELAERTRLQTRLSLLEHQNQLIANGFEELKRTKSALEARIARQFRTVITTYRAAQSMDVTDEARLSRGLDQLIQSVLSPQKYSLWTLAPDGFVLERAVGWQEDDHFERRLDLGHPVVRHLLAREPALCAARPMDERKLMGQGLLAGALTDLDSGEIVGMLKVEETAFLDFNLYTLENFNVICSWIAAARMRARRWQQLQADRLTGANDLLMTAEVSERIYALLVQLGRRKGFSSSQLIVRPVDPDALAPEQHSILALALGEAARATFRSTDLAFEREADDAEYAILLPGTPLDDAELLGSKLRQAMAGHLPPSVPLDQILIEARPIEETAPAPAPSGGGSA